MRSLILTILLLAVVAVPLQAQTSPCGDVDAPPLSMLFPDEIAGMDRELYDTRDGCFTYLYKPTAFKPVDNDGGPWTVVMIEPHDDPFLGDTRDGLVRHYETAGMPFHEVGDWPITRSETLAGEEFVTLKDDLRITVVVKDGTDAMSSKALADQFFGILLPRTALRCSGG